MIKQIDIRNFRAFEKVSLKDCTPITLLVGDNGSGKTALLEALFMASGASPELALRTKAWRGFNITAEGAEKDVYENIWGDLFFDSNTDNEVWIRLTSENTSDTPRLLTISKVSQRLPIPTSRSNPQIVYDAVESFKFRWKGPGKFDSTKTPHIENGKLNMGGSSDTPLKVTFFAANQTYSTPETVSRFSRISKANKKPEAVRLFATLFPSVSDITIELNGGSPMLYARTYDSEKMFPINMMSGGMNKLASILFAIPHLEGGYILIDEIENGFYYKKLPLVWAAISTFAKAYNVQVFASTHSNECLAAVGELARADPTRFCLVRAVRQKDRSILRQFSGREFASALSDDIEVR